MASKWRGISKHGHRAPFFTPSNGLENHTCQKSKFDEILRGKRVREATSANQLNTICACVSRHLKQLVFPGSEIQTFSQGKPPYDVRSPRETTPTTFAPHDPCSFPTILDSAFPPVLDIFETALLAAKHKRERMNCYLLN